MTELIYEKDKSFLKSFLEDDDVSKLELIYSNKSKKQKVNAYYSTHKFFPNVTFLKDLGFLKVFL